LPHRLGIGGLPRQPAGSASWRGGQGERTDEPARGRLAGGRRARKSFNRERALTLPPASAARTTFAIVADRAGFDALEPEWNDLFARAGRDTHVFQTFNWN
jgi:hypothetical protein